ncbi:hypothetical protein E2542_SST23001 [Spatholobus suberectus]|nr:hypothetical protein E2542_SST23001 [Spatholobus suberectus]
MEKVMNLLFEKHRSSLGSEVRIIPESPLDPCIQTTAPSPESDASTTASSRLGITASSIRRCRAAVMRAAVDRHVFASLHRTANPYCCVMALPLSRHKAPYAAWRWRYGAG